MGSSRYASPPLVGRRTLIVQSTDFSHYLPLQVALQRDQRTLNVLSANSVDQMAALRQSDHLDSKQRNTSKCDCSHLSERSALRVGHGGAGHGAQRPD